MIERGIAGLPVAPRKGGAIQEFFPAGGPLQPASLPVQHWSKPPGLYTFVRFVIVGAGGGGGSGRRGAAGTVRCAGGGGGAGSISTFDLLYERCPSDILINLGFGGAGGAAQTADDTDGLPGQAGQSSDLSWYDTRNPNTISAPRRLCAAAGGSLGSGGTALTGTGGSGSSGGEQSGGSGASASTSGGVGVNASAAGSIPPGVCGGSSGGGLTSGDVVGTGGTGFTNGHLGSPVAPLPCDETQFPSGWFYGGMGGAGSDANKIANALAAGDGWRGGGGGSGGASLNGFNSGAGGRGGDAYAIFICY